MDASQKLHVLEGETGAQEQEMQQSQTRHQPMASKGRHPHDSTETIKVKQKAPSSAASMLQKYEKKTKSYITKHVPKLYKHPQNEQSINNTRITAKLHRDILGIFYLQKKISPLRGILINSMYHHRKQLHQINYCDGT